MHYGGLWMGSQDAETIAGGKDVRDNPRRENFDERRDPAALAQSFIDDHHVGCMLRRRRDNLWWEVHW